MRPSTGHRLTSVGSFSATGGSSAIARSTTAGSTAAVRHASAIDRRPPQQKSMPSSSKTLAVRKSVATISPTVTLWNGSLISPPDEFRVASNGIERYDRRHIDENTQTMAERLDELLRRTTIFRRLSADDRQRLASVATVRTYDKGASLFNEGDASDQLYTVVD